jgi:hypothetical protein
MKSAVCPKFLTETTLRSSRIVASPRVIRILVDKRADTAKSLPEVLCAVGSLVCQRPGETVADGMMRSTYIYSECRGAASSFIDALEARNSA